MGIAITFVAVGGLYAGELSLSFGKVSPESLVIESGVLATVIYWITASMVRSVFTRERSLDTIKWLASKDAASGWLWATFVSWGFVLATAAAGSGTAKIAVPAADTLTLIISVGTAMTVTYRVQYVEWVVAPPEVLKAKQGGKAAVRAAIRWRLRTKPRMIAMQATVATVIPIALAALVVAAIRTTAWPAYCLACTIAGLAGIRLWVQWHLGGGLGRLWRRPRSMRPYGHP